MKKLLLPIIALFPTTIIADEVSDRLNSLREIRREQIKKEMDIINLKHLNALRKYNDKNPSPEIEKEIEVLKALADQRFPEELKFPKAGVVIQKKYVKPKKLRKPEDTINHLVGSMWRYYNNAEYLGEGYDMVFTSATTVTIGEKSYQWKAKEDGVIWIGYGEVGIKMWFTEKSGKRLQGHVSDHAGKKKTATWK